MAPNLSRFRTTGHRSSFWSLGLGGSHEEEAQGVLLLDTNMGEQTERCGNFNHLWMMFRRQTDRFSTSTSRFYLSVVETSDGKTWENMGKKRTCNTTSKHTMDGCEILHQLMGKIP